MKKSHYWSAANLKLHVTSMSFNTWARDMVMYYWAAGTLFWQLSIDHNIDANIKDARWRLP